MAEQSAALYRAGEGEPLLLLHGFTATWRCWKPVLADLVADFEVVAPTLHGHAGGPAFPPGTSRNPEGAVDLLEGWLDEHGLGEVHVCGNSMGGAFALELAKRGRARSVVALAPGGGWTHGDPEGDRLVRFFRRQIRMARASAPRIHRVVARPGTRRLALRDAMCHGELLHPHDAAEMVRESVRCEVVDIVFDAIRTGSACVVDLDRISCPVTLAWPENDRILPMAKHSPRFRREIPGVEWRVLRGAGHVPMWDDPYAITALIRETAAKAGSAESLAPAA